MESVTVVLARASILLDLVTLDPKGLMSPLDAIKSLIERYSFAKFPKLEDFNIQKGIHFSYGKLGDINIVNFAMFETGIVVDTGLSTDSAETVLLDFLDSVRKTLGATFQVHRRVFLSHLVFNSSMRIAALHPVLQQIADRVAASVSRDLDQPFRFEPTAVYLNTDLSQTKLQPATFTIDRRAEMPFSENSYFSAAPLRTAEHIEVIRQFEAALLGT